MRPTNFQAVTILVLLILICACQKQTPTRDTSLQVQSQSWQYPIRLGNERTNVHNLLGRPGRATSELEEYPLSGVSVWFDLNGRVNKLNFADEAIMLYSAGPMDQIPSDRLVLFAVSPKMDCEAFKRALGVPAKEAIERSKSSAELHCIWKDSAYVIDALFLNAARTYEGKSLQNGTLIWFEVTRGL